MLSLTVAVFGLSVVATDRLNLTDRGKLGSKYHVVVALDGFAGGGGFGANVNDTLLLLHLLRLAWWFALLSLACSLMLVTTALLSRFLLAHGFALLIRSKAMLMARVWAGALYLKTDRLLLARQLDRAVVDGLGLLTRLLFIIAAWAIVLC